jgi:hypothetical protein
MTPVSASRFRFLVRKFLVREDRTTTKTFPMSFLLSPWPLALAPWAVRGRLRGGESSPRPGPGRAIAYLGLGLAAAGLLFWFDYPVRARRVLYTAVNAQPAKGPARIPIMPQHPGVQHYLSFEPAASAFGSVEPFQMRLSNERPRGTVVAASPPCRGGRRSASLRWSGASTRCC